MESLFVRMDLFDLTLFGLLVFLLVAKGRSCEEPVSRAIYCCTAAFSCLLFLIQRSPVG